MNNEFEEKKFDARITHQLLSITKELSGWKILPGEEDAKDYYQYLIFKIESGKITEIMP